MCRSSLSWRGFCSCRWPYNGTCLHFYGCSGGPGSRDYSSCGRHRSECLCCCAATIQDRLLIGGGGSCGDRVNSRVSTWPLCMSCIHCNSCCRCWLITWSLDWKSGYVILQYFRLRFGYFFILNLWLWINSIFFFNNNKEESKKERHDDKTSTNGCFKINPTVVILGYLTPLTSSININKTFITTSTKAFKAPGFAWRVLHHTLDTTLPLTQITSKPPRLHI